MKPAFQLLEERVKRLHAGMGRAGSPAFRRRRSGASRTRWAITARDQKIELPIAWTDCWGKEHESVTGNPVAFHAMRGLAAHSNGFHTIRALAILMTLLGTIDRPGGFRHKAPFPRAIPPQREAAERAAMRCKPNTPLGGLALGWPASPDDLFVDDDGRPGAHRQGLLVGVPARRCTG